MPRRSEIFAQPLPDAAQEASRREPRGVRRFGLFRHCEEQQPRGGGKSRAVRRFGETLDARRAADPHLLVKDEPGQLSHPM